MSSITEYFETVRPYNASHDNIEIRMAGEQVEILAQDDLQTTARGLYNQLEAHAEAPLVFAKFGVMDDGRTKYVVSSS